ncbi:hypothetical protein C3747_8g504 [Trypanosoma cruzi]|uniref:Endonuclease/exonuclease/phosphatase domain-containing protein n=1 Tax=Trypanosoma cruzi TaxID=5693 RepID=A0A2V2XIM6_TRYCR|nr:hypothetical protein C3747_8g504 [Trypanosoma cruzi]
MRSHLVAVLGLWLHIGTPLRCIAASTTENKTTPPLEKVPRHARCGEVRRSACRLSDKTARPFRCGHSVDITRCGELQKNPEAEEDGFITIWQLNIAGLSSVKKIASAVRLEQHPPVIVLPQETNTRSATAAKLYGYNGVLQARTGRAGGVATLVRHSLPCECLTLPGTDLLETIAASATPQGCPSICVVNLYNPPTATVQSSSFISAILRLGPAAIIAGDLNLHRELWDRHLPSTTGGEDLSSTLIDMDFGLANDPAQATRSTNRNVSSPEATAYRVLRVTHWQSTLYMDSDHCLLSYSVGMDNGIPRIANTLPRREKATSALRKADWPAFISLCETLLATASAWLDPRGGILRAAERHIPRGSRESPKQSGQTKWNKPSPPRKQHTKHTHRLTRRQPASRRINPKCGEPKSSLTPWLHYASGRPCEKLEASSSPSWRYLRGVAAPHPHPLESVVLRTDLRTASVLYLGNRQICSSIILCEFHVPYRLMLLLLLAALLWFLVTGKWIDLSRRMSLAWPFVTLRSAQPLATRTC